MNGIDNFDGSLKAIETEYNGYKFRSRLEARWAVFFDELGLEYIYEGDGYDLGDGIYYLPDFYFPVGRFFFEVKGAWPSSGDLEKIRRLSEQSGKPVYFSNGEVGKNPLNCAVNGSWMPEWYAFYITRKKNVAICPWLDDGEQIKIDFATRTARRVRFEDDY